MIKKLIIISFSFFMFAFLVSCKTTNATTSNNPEVLKKEISDLKKQIKKDDIQNQKDDDKIKKTNDMLTASLKKEIDKKQIIINMYRDVLTINISEEIFFVSGSALIKNDGKMVLNRIGEILKYFPEKMIKIEGHTDNSLIFGKLKEVFANNWELGATRAINVAVYFENVLNIDPTRLEVASFSKYRPIAPNNSDVNKSKNRRIEIILLNKNRYQYQNMGVADN